MLILDYSGIMHSNIAAQIGFDPEVGASVDEALIRHSIINTIRAINLEHRHQYGDLVIVFDAKGNYWRKGVFPNYKIRRKKNRDESVLDWNLIFQTTSKVKDEITENLPYRTLEVPAAEADDVIAELVRSCGAAEPIMIISGDEDLIQLHDEFGGRVNQYDPVRKKAVGHASPKAHLLEKIIRGDAGDDVPNVMMPDDTFIQGIRQKPITAKRLEEFSRDLPRGVGTDDHLRNYKRNDLLINLDNIPSEVKQNIRQHLARPHTRSTKNLSNYFVKHRLKQLWEQIGDF